MTSSQKKTNYRPFFKGEKRYFHAVAQPQEDEFPDKKAGDVIEIKESGRIIIKIKK